MIKTIIGKGAARKGALVIILIAVMGCMTGCIITDNNDEYERKEFRSTDSISEISVIDKNADITVQITDDREAFVEYSDSPADPWYTIDVVKGLLKIEKTQGTVGVDDNSVIIHLPQKEYQKISIKTTNGDITFKGTASSNYECFTENGDIKGEIAGNEAEYMIVAAAKNGGSNLKNNVIESSKTIEFDVKNGDIDVEFKDY